MGWTTIGYIHGSKPHFHAKKVIGGESGRTRSCLETLYHVVIFAFTHLVPMMHLMTCILSYPWIDLPLNFRFNLSLEFLFLLKMKMEIIKTLHCVLFSHLVSAHRVTKPPLSITWREVYIIFFRLSARREFQGRSNSWSFTDLMLFSTAIDFASTLGIFCLMIVGFNVHIECLAQPFSLLHERWIMKHKVLRAVRFNGSIETVLRLMQS